MRPCENLARATRVAVLFAISMSACTPTIVHTSAPPPRPGVTAPPPTPPPPRPTPGASWDSRGWTLLGETTVDYGRPVDKDRITVGRDAGNFDRLMLVVLDGDLDLIDMTLSVGRGGNAFKPTVKQYYRENSRTRAIDLPGEYRTTIHYIDFTYRNIPGGARAKVQVWAKGGGPR